MKRIFKNKVLKDYYKHYYVFLLPIFFVLHGFQENLFLINILDALFLLGIYLFIASLSFVFFILIFKISLKAGLATLVTFTLFFFFGAYHDFIKNLGLNFFTSYSFILPLSILIYFLILFIIKKKVIPNKIINYIKFLLIILIFLDIFIVCFKIATSTNDEFDLSTTRITKRPDIYLILLDEYPGNEQLKVNFKFDNHVFLNSLSSLGFKIADSSNSNYIATPFSIASLLSMDYLSLKDLNYTDHNLNYCFKKIYNSKVLSGFQSLNYDFINLSIFDFPQKPSLINKTFLKSGIELIVSQTLFSRLKRDIYENFIFQKLKNSNLYKQIIFKDLENNKLLYHKTIEEAQVKKNHSRFIYTHLMMPHFPYYFDSTSKLNQIGDLSPENLTNKELFFQYLLHVNKEVLKLMSYIISNSKDAIIILLSDHGFRYIDQYENLKYSNLAAIYDPENQIKSFHSTISNVNIFRHLFNDLFNSKLRLLENKKFK